jgi:hypothetical protein
MSSRRLHILVPLLALALAPGCSTEGKKDVAKSALASMAPEQRRDSFEATARLLDEQPELVDELYVVMRRHRPTMHRFLVNATSQDLKEPWLADMAAEVLADHPAAIEPTFIAAMDAIAPEPEARAAMNRAVARRAEKAVDIMTDSPETMDRVLAASMVTLERKPRARENVRAAVHQQRQQIIAFAKANPELGRDLTEDLLHQVVKDSPVLEKVLRAAGALDKEGPAKGKSDKK